MVLGAPVRNFRGRNLRMRIARPLGLGAAGPRRDSGFDILVILRNIRRPACVSPVPRLASATAPRALRERVTHATPVETRDTRALAGTRSRSRSGPIVPQPRYACHNYFSGPGYVLIRIFERLLYAPTRESGRDPRIDTTATRNIPVPPPRSGTRMRKVCAMSAQTARRVLDPRRMVGIGSARGPAGGTWRHERGGERRRGRRAGGAPGSRARLVLTAFLTAGLSRRQTSLKVQACAVDLSRCVYGVLPAAVCASSSSDSRSCQALIR